MGPREIIIILLIVVLLFGAPKLPELARSIGKSMRILKDETRSLSDDNKADEATPAPRADAEQAQQRGAAPIPDSTVTPDYRVDTPDNDGRGTR